MKAIQVTNTMVQAFVETAQKMLDTLRKGQPKRVELAGSFADPGLAQVARQTAEETEMEIELLEAFIQEHAKPCKQMPSGFIGK